MALDSTQLHSGLPVKVGSSEGRLIDGSQLSYVEDENGTVTVYSTDYLLAEGERKLTQQEQEAQDNNPDRARVAELESQLAALRSRPEAAPTPGPVQQTPTATPASPADLPEDATGTSQDAPTEANTEPVHQPGESPTAEQSVSRSNE